LNVRSNVHIDFGWTEWFDGNLCALLWAMIHKLRQTHDHAFTADESQVRTKFDFMFRNGFIKSESPVVDEQKSTVPVKSFNCNDKEGFCSYIQNELLSHRGMPADIDTELKDRINEDLLEVFCNTNHHANTTDPFFVGGQYYPRMGHLKFTMVDIGDGFLPRISKVTNGIIKTNLEAIHWALDGNSTKIVLDQCPGGLGIKNMLKYCHDNGGVFQIISNNGFWSSDLYGSLFDEGRELPTPFMGTTINLQFQKK
jgi:hypothetical protein